MAHELTTVNVVNGIKIQFSDFWQDFIVLLPKGNGKSELHRFSSEDAAAIFIEEHMEKHQRTG